MIPQFHTILCMIFVGDELVSPQYLHDKHKDRLFCLEHRVLPDHIFPKLLIILYHKHKFILMEKINAPTKKFVLSIATPIISNFNKTVIIIRNLSFKSIKKKKSFFQIALQSEPEKECTIFSFCSQIYRLQGWNSTNFFRCFLT